MSNKCVDYITKEDKLLLSIKNSKSFKCLLGAIDSNDENFLENVEFNISYRQPQYLKNRLKGQFVKEKSILGSEYYIEG